MLKDIETKIENASMQEYYNDKTNQLVSYRITPDQGYMLHHSALDIEIYDENILEPTGKIELGYTDSFIMINKNYNFIQNISNIYTILNNGN